MESLTLLFVVFASLALVLVLVSLRWSRNGRGRTFILALFALLLPAATVLAYMEQTRWGSVIMAVAGAVVAVLMLRLQQVW